MNIYPVITALMAARKAATAGPVEWTVDRTSGQGCLALESPSIQTRVLAIPLGCTEGYRPYDEDRTYIAAAYDPALITELEAVDAKIVTQYAKIADLENRLYRATHCGYCNEELRRARCSWNHNDE